MLFKMVSLLLEVAGELLTSLCLLRWYMQLQRISFANPVGHLIFTATDWMVMPLRRLISPRGSWDITSILAGIFVQMVQYGLLWGLFLSSHTPWLWWPWMAVWGMVWVGIGGSMLLLVVYAVLSWVPTASPFSHLLNQLCAPMLKPARSIIPLVRGIDFSALVTLVVLQLLLIAIDHVRGQWGMVFGGG